MSHVDESERNGFEVCRTFPVPVFSVFHRVRSGGGEGLLTLEGTLRKGVWVDHLYFPETFDLLQYDYTSDQY